jgi:hypothetical protein
MASSKKGKVAVSKVRPATTGAAARSKPTKSSPAAWPRAAHSAARPPVAQSTAPEPPARAARRQAVDLGRVDPALFAPLSEGERAAALRCLLEDERVRALAKVGRYRTVAIESLVVKPPDPLAGRRLARLQIYDYAGDRCVDACVDLDHGAVCHVTTSTAQPMLSRDEELEAQAVAADDERVKRLLEAGALATSVMHYWSLRPQEIAYRRRTAAVLYGEPGARPHAVAVVNLIDRVVVDVVLAEQW